MDSLGKIFLVGLLAFFYIGVLCLIFNPDVCDRYSQFYLERSLKAYPNAKPFPRNGRYVWELIDRSSQRKCLSEDPIKIFPEKMDRYMRDLF